MFSVRNYRDLFAWQVVFALARRICEITGQIPTSEAYGLTSQRRRCAVSIPSNLAEGAGRAGKKEFAHFVTLARGSLNELKTQLAQALRYCEMADELKQDIKRLFARRNGLRNSLNS